MVTRWGFFIMAKEKKEIPKGTILCPECQLKWIYPAYESLCPTCMHSSQTYVEKKDEKKTGPKSSLDNNLSSI